MGDSDCTPEWPAGLADPSTYSEHVIATLHRVFDLARDGQVREAVDRLQTDIGTPSGLANAWRPGGQALFTLLHHAAWHGSELAVVQRLRELGALVRVPDSRGRTPGDVARERGHSRLTQLLPASDDGESLDRDGVLSDRLHGLVTDRVRRAGLAVGLRPLPVGALADVPMTSAVWVPIPGMYGGFAVRRREQHLYVESWSRVVGGSGEAHVVLESGAYLVDRGFV